MLWNELFTKENEPDGEQISEFIGAPLWNALDNFLREAYNVKPKLFFSNCAMDKGLWKGWNIKYKKSGKALCTVYPKQGYFLLLLPLATRELNEADLLIPTCCEYTQNLYNKAIVGHTGKYLAFEVNDEKIIDDVKKLVDVRVKIK
jgi:AraC family transcriptional regulator